MRHILNTFITVVRAVYRLATSWTRVLRSLDLGVRAIDGEPYGVAGFLLNATPADDARLQSSANQAAEKSSLLKIYGATGHRSGSRVRLFRSPRRCKLHSYCGRSTLVNVASAVI